MQGCKDVGRLCCGADVLCHLSSASGCPQQHTGALLAIFHLLESPYPNVSPADFTSCFSHSLLCNTYATAHCSDRTWQSTFRPELPMQVRRHAAEQLYITFLGRVDEDEGGPEPTRDYEQAADLLLAVAWDGPLEEVLEQKAELQSMLQLYKLRAV